MKLSIFVPLAAFLAFTVAELNEVDPSPCLNRCLTEAAAVAGCISQYDTKCTCPSAAFKDTLGDCINTSCTPADLQDALTLHTQRCDTPQTDSFGVKAKAT
ncbi:hypothetical protein N7495_008681 [Penicillium taxi]|uniref:uncharacterized protein n=1 Tax=Penicillium taxi TaxID=168475 RepID=UPI0025454A85|nr:uncharacterized protein N7495_008681 [Penicillium taxi]KAJ5888640.1 hypothetical protein N7495_008681 [Penicillium taxi]